MLEKLKLVSRLFLGAMLLIAGLNGFFHFMPIPQPTPEAGALFGALAKTGYFFPFIKAVEILVGISLVLNRFVALALVVFFPIIVGIAQINFILNPGATLHTLMYLVPHLFLLYCYREQYRPLFKAR